MWTFRDASHPNTRPDPAPPSGVLLLVRRDPSGEEVGMMTFRVAGDRRPPMPVGRLFGSCPWCGVHLHEKRRQWHPRCVRAYRIACFSKDQRDAVFERDAGVCAVCSAKPNEKRDHQGFLIGWDADHIRPLWSTPQEVSLEDRDAWWGLANLQTLCWDCHKAKSRREANERAARRSRQVSMPLTCSEEARS